MFDSWELVYGDCKEPKNEIVCQTSLLLSNKHVFQQTPTLNKNYAIQQTCMLCFAIYVS